MVYKEEHQQFPNKYANLHSRIKCTRKKMKEGMLPPEIEDVQEVYGDEDEPLSNLIQK